MRRTTRWRSPRRSQRGTRRSQRARRGTRRRRRVQELHPTSASVRPVMRVRQKRRKRTTRMSEAAAAALSCCCVSAACSAQLSDQGPTATARNVKWWVGLVKWVGGTAAAGHRFCTGTTATFLASSSTERGHAHAVIQHVFCASEQVLLAGCWTWVSQSCRAVACVTVFTVFPEPAAFGSLKEAPGYIASKARNTLTR